MKGYENIEVRFPFNNIQMDISLPDINLNKALDEWGKVTCYNPIKQQLSNTIELLERKGTPESEAEMKRDVAILTDLNAEIANPLNFSEIPDIVQFIANPYDISIIGDKPEYSKLVENNNYINGLLTPKQQESSSSSSAAAAGPAQFESTIPKEVPFLIRLMQQLTREIDSYFYYINGTKQPKFPIDEKEAKLPAGTPLFKTACNGYGRLLNNIQHVYRGGNQGLEWSKVNIQILYCFLGSSPFETYYSLNFVPKILQPSVAKGSYPEFWYAKAKRDGGGSLIPDVSIDWMIRNYKDYYIDSKFFKLDPITENAEDGNFLQYVKNGTTVLVKVDTSIIIEVVQTWYIYLTNIEAVARDGGSTYNGLVIAAVVEKTVTDITQEIVHYSSQFRWLVTKNTRDNLLRNNITLPEPILRNLGEIIMSGDNRFTKAVKNSYKKVFNRSPPTTPPRVVEEEAQIQGHNRISDYVDEKGNLAGPGYWQGEVGTEDIDGGRKKNKTRRKTKKRKTSIKGKAKF